MIGQVVEAVVGNRCQVLRGGRKDGEWAVVSRHVRDLQVGDMVRVFEDRGQLWVVALIGTGPVQVVNLITPPPPLTETQPVQRGTEVISPAWSGTFRGGSWRGDTSHMIQGDGGWGRSWGAAFWPAKIRELGTLTAGRIHCERLSFGSYAVQRPTMRLLAGGKTSSYPATLATAQGPGLGSPGSTARFDVPADWLPRLASGEAGGIGIGVDASTPYMRLDGPDFTGSFDWERT